MTDNTIQFILSGILLGLSAGISPGPLLTLVLTQTIKHNKKEGVKIAISPLITDFPIILLTAFVFSKLTNFDVVLAAISFMGGMYIAYLGVESIRIKGLDLNINKSASDSLKKGIVANILSPHPYLFWATVGIPLLFKAFEIDILTAALFLVSFYVCLVGVKVLVAFMVARSKVYFNQKVYVVVMRILGLVLLMFSLMFFYNGITYL